MASPYELLMGDSGLDAEATNDNTFDDGETDAFAASLDDQLADGDNNTYANPYGLKTPQHVSLFALCENAAAGKPPQPEEWLSKLIADLASVSEDSMLRMLLDALGSAKGARFGMKGGSGHITCKLSLKACPESEIVVVSLPGLTPSSASNGKAAPISSFTVHKDFTLMIKCIFYVMHFIEIMAEKIKKEKGSPKKEDVHQYLDQLDKAVSYICFHTRRIAS